MIKLDYNMSRDYCSSWTAIDAIREMSQNALDSGKAYAHVITDKRVVVSTYDTVLTHNVFTLGKSDKPEGSIGQFGEGFKIGMLVLTRLGLEPQIDTGNLRVTGAFVVNAFTGEATFNLLIDVLDTEYGKTVFSCLNTDIDIDELKEKITHFSSNPLSKPEYCQLLDNRPGMIYVNGLYICKDKRLTKGYNFAPSLLKLNRDRDIVIGIESALAKYYVKHGKAEDIYALIKAEAYDIEYVYIWMDEKLKTALKELFYSNYGANATIHQNNAYTGSFSPRQYNTFRAAGIATSKFVPGVHSEPSKEIVKFYETNKKHMRRKAKVELDSLIERAKTWKR